MEEPQPWLGTCFESPSCTLSPSICSISTPQMILYSQLLSLISRIKSTIEPMMVPSDTFHGSQKLPPFFSASRCLSEQLMSRKQRCGVSSVSGNNTRSKTITSYCLWVTSIAISSNSGRTGGGHVAKAKYTDPKRKYHSTFSTLIGPLVARFKCGGHASG